MEMRDRDDPWLADRVAVLWEVHFSDVPRGYAIVTKFGSRARYRFGSICARNGVTLITINQLFANPIVPVYVVDATLGHELAHYAHGYGSGLPKRHAHAHRGGVVDKELEARGLGELYTRAAEWRAAYWDAFYEEVCGDIGLRRAARDASSRAMWDRWLCQPDRKNQSQLASCLVRVQERFHAASLSTSTLRVEWLCATMRQSALSYWYARERTLRIHSLAAHVKAPEYIIDFEIAYWLARLNVGGKWESVYATLRRAGMESVAQQALDWRKRSWTAFRNRHYPTE